MQFASIQMTSKAGFTFTFMGNSKGSVSMKHTEQTTDKSYGISRFDDDKRRAHGWRVSLRRHGTKLVENFPDKKYGGRQKALKLAMHFRDELLGKFPPITREEMCRIRRSNNKSGINGVYTYAKRYKLRDGSSRETWYWEATWPAEQGKHVSINFSVKKYGEELARSMAIRARHKGIEDMEGPFWASERGCLKARNMRQRAGNTPSSSRKVA
jgi:hypothetical protein